MFIWWYIFFRMFNVNICSEKPAISFRLENTCFKREKLTQTLTKNLGEYCKILKANTRQTLAQ